MSITARPPSSLSPYKIAVVCASGIGDALILHMVSHHLKILNFDVTTFSNHLSGFGPWLSGYQLKMQPNLEEIEEIFSSFDAIFLQHDNSPKAKKISQLPIPIYTLYGAHLTSKHGALKPNLDFVCDPQKNMVENTLSAMDRFFGGHSRENGLIPPSGLIHRRYKKRIAIHPTSSSIEKNWSEGKFSALADRLKKEGYDPVFTVAPHETVKWGGPLFPTLEDLASFIYESDGLIGNDSGPVHLASYLQIPYLVIGYNPILLQLWQPGWGRGSIAAPPKWLMKWKWGRSKWRYFITKHMVLKKIISII